MFCIIKYIVLKKRKDVDNQAIFAFSPRIFVQTKRKKSINVETLVSHYKIEHITTTSDNI